MLNINIYILFYMYQIVYPTIDDILTIDNKHILDLPIPSITDDHQ